MAATRHVAVSGVAHAACASPVQQHARPPSLAGGALMKEGRVISSGSGGATARAFWARPPLPALVPSLPPSLPRKHARP